MLYPLQLLQVFQGTNENKKKSLLTRVFHTVHLFMMDIEAKFQAAVKVIKSLPTDGPYQPSNDTKLKFYSLYKQATEGPCKQGKPAFWDVIGRVKWEHWKKLGDLGKEEAMLTYIEELKKIVETMSFSGDVQNFLDSIGPFYEFISLNSPQLDHIKNAVDRATSSSGSCTSTSSESASPSNSFPSSPETTPQTTPAKEADNIVIAAVDKPSCELSVASETPQQIHNNNNNNNYVHTNGHIPNQKASVNHLNVTEETTLGAIPPSSPVHKAVANGHAKRYSIEDIEKEDEIIEVYTEVTPNLEGNGPATTTTITGSQSNNSTDSEEYYSGDSDPDGDFQSNVQVPTVTVSSPSKTSKPGTSSSVRRMKSKSQSSSTEPRVYIMDDGYSNKVDAMTVLQSTVDRLNRDVEHVLARLRILEAAYSANPTGVHSNTVVRSDVDDSRQSQSRRLIPFRQLSKLTWAVIFTWPIAVHFIFKLITSWMDRRRKLRSRPLAILRA